MLDGRPLFVVLLWCVWSTHGFPTAWALVHRGCPCRMPKQDGIGGRAPTLLCGCLRVLGQVVLCRSGGLVCGHRWITLLSCTPPRLVRYASSAHEAFLDQLMFARSIARAFASSTAPPRVQVHLRGRERDFLEIRGVSRHCSGLARPDSSCSRAPSSRGYSCSTLSFFLVHVIHCHVLPLDVLQLSLAFVSTRP